MSKITFKDPAASKPKLTEMISGCFYRNTMNGSLVFAAHTNGAENPVLLENGEPKDFSPVVSISADPDVNGYMLKGLFGRVEDYEEVDVEITVKR